ncbi:UbiD family decarboxylase [Microtetraspora fusca]|uniref:UbiD family decarboxylase n=1 Tax=Microtetraspora fusca TaxID=1997 RepID=UPI00082A4810|nr:UbiD family decarboxylase [Microtetraspora fusca]
MSSAAPADLRSFLCDLVAADPDALVTVAGEVDPAYELSAVVKALEPHGAPAVRFERVKGAGMPVVAGLYGTRRRIALALGVDVDAAVAHVLDRMRHPLPVRHAERAPVHEVVERGEEVDLSALPFGVHSRDDAGRYITSGVTLVRDPATGKLNTGMYRMMVLDRNHITVNAAPDHDLGRAIHAAAEAGRDLPIAIVIGHHPAYAITSQLKHGTDVDSHEVTGALLGRPLDVVPGVGVDLEVPAYAEIVLEGVIHTRDLVGEGPFGEFTYYYGAARAPRCTITAVTRRADAIFNDLHPTHAEHRCLWLFPGREARLLEAVRASVPTVRAVRIPFHGGSLSAYIALEKRHEADGRQAILAAFARDHFLKHVIVVDPDVDVFDDREVLWALNVRFQADRDLIRLDHAKGIKMDPSATRLGSVDRPDVVTAKLGFDATRPVRTAFPERADLPPPGFDAVDLTEYVDPATMARIRSFARVTTAAAE